MLSKYHYYESMRQVRVKQVSAGKNKGGGVKKVSNDFEGVSFDPLTNKFTTTTTTTTLFMNGP